MSGTVRQQPPVQHPHYANHDPHYANNDPHYVRDDRHYTQDDRQHSATDGRIPVANGRPSAFASQSQFVDSRGPAVEDRRTHASSLRVQAPDMPVPAPATATWRRQASLADRSSPAVSSVQTKSTAASTTITAPKVTIISSMAQKMSASTEKQVLASLDDGDEKMETRCLQNLLDEDDAVVSTASPEGPVDPPASPALAPTTSTADEEVTEIMEITTNGTCESDVSSIVDSYVKETNPILAVNQVVSNRWMSSALEMDVKTVHSV